MLLERIKENFKLKDKLVYLSKSSNCTYSELEDKVKKIYSYLIKENITGRVVCIGHKEIEMLASFIACSFVGITYVPVDVSLPKKRLEYILKDVNPSLVLNKDKITEILDREVEEDIILDIKMRVEDVYYIIYTSGSTGNPKGVEVTYANLESFVKWFVNVLPKENIKVLNTALFSFDLSVADIYFSLYTASTLCIAESNFVTNAKGLYDELKWLDVNVTVMTPSYAYMLLTDKSFNSKLLPNLDTMYFCGETLTKKTVDRLKERFAGVQIINSYGPTECTVAISSIDVTNIEENRFPVGYIKEDTHVYILDENLEETTGKGEIVITGDSVAKGYSNLDTDKFFVYKDRWAYRTGDIGYIKDNILNFDSRKDIQIKFMGHRIELEDITANILNVDDVENAVTFTKKNEETIVTRIISCVKLKETSNLDAKTLETILKEKLPMYMIPKIKLVDEIKLNANGKIDKKQMEEMYSGR